MLLILLLIFFLHCKIFIHKNKFLKMLPRFYVCLAEILLIVKSLKLIDNNKNNKFLKAYDAIFLTDWGVVVFFPFMLL